MQNSTVTPTTTILFEIYGNSFKFYYITHVVPSSHVECTGATWNLLRFPMFSECGFVAEPSRVVVTIALDVTHISMSLNHFTHFSLAVHTFFCIPTRERVYVSNSPVTVSGRCTFHTLGECMLFCFFALLMGSKRTRSSYHRV